ncbi:hypothetical protein M3Y98_00519800 [Aphelenchoides besseyi]|nr:hypothetical protein M3Y98_00519800 [Aphelenchoides besseyi]KAI6207935.1 hypothetical protein M3Y96_00061400 [Aphelenchoides besseyi]
MTVKKPLFSSDRELPLSVALSLIFAIVVLALLPGFAILGYYQSFVLGLALDFTFFSIAAYAFQSVCSTAIMIVAVIVYADLAFPFVMWSFSIIFSRIRVD